MFLWNLFSLTVLVFLVKIKSSFGDSVKNNYFTSCSRSSPNFEKCIAKAITEARPNFVNGIPEIGFPSIEPLVFSPINFKETNRYFKISVHFPKAEIRGFSNMTVKNVNVSGDINSEMTINLTITSPAFEGWTKWSGKGRAFQFSVNGGGIVDVNLTQTDFKLIIKGRAAVNEKDGKKYFAIKSVTMIPILRKAQAYVTGLFPKDENLNKMANKIVNRNMSFMLRIIGQYPEKYMSGEFEKIVRIIFDTWPIDQLMPE